VSVYPFTSAVKGSPDPVAFLMVRTRCCGPPRAMCCPQSAVLHLCVAR
jgi:hypothetical protein